MQQILDDFQRIDDRILRVQFLLVTLLVGTGVEIVGEIGKEFLIKIIEGFDVEFLLLAECFQAFQCCKIGTLSGGNASFPSAVQVFKLFIHLFIEVGYGRCGGGFRHLSLFDNGADSAL